MWQKIQGSRGPRIFGYIIFVPVVLGLIVAPSVVFWMPVSLFPIVPVIVIAFLLIAILLFRIAVAIVRRASSLHEVDLEQCALFAGLILALLAGATLYAQALVGRPLGAGVQIELPNKTEIASLNSFRVD